MIRFAGPQKKMAAAIALPLLLIFGIAVASVFPTASNQGYAPEQPIPFSHKLHAGTNKIACTYCHSGAEKSRHAGVPAMNVCMNCHSVVKLDSPHIQNLRKHFEEKKPLEWIRVHELADYVYFPHKRHVARGLACEACHGNVKAMERIEQHSPLTMGWCIDCHRGRTTPRNVAAKILAEKPALPPGHVAATQCTTCHN